MAWLNSDWTYRKKVTITGQAGASTNYQVKFLVGNSSSATGIDFHLSGNSSDFPASKDDGGDLRFTGSDGTTSLDFWVESVSGTGASAVATIWVEVADDLGSNVDIYCYYGNSSLPANGSSGANTFIFFDDFDGTSLDTTKWTDNSAGASVSGSVCSFSAIVGSAQNIRAINSVNDKVRIRTLRKYVMGSNYDTMAFGLDDGTTGALRMGGDDYIAIGVDRTYSNQEKHRSKASGTLTTGATTPAKTENVFAVYEVTRDSVSPKSTALFGNSGSTDTITSNVPSIALYPIFDVKTSTCTHYIDWVFIGKYIATEPSFSSVGVEETNTSTTTENASFFGMNF